MSCHVMSCRHCCINSKKYLSKTFSFHKIIYKYFAGFFACYLDCHASLHQRWADACSASNDEKNIVITRFCKNRSNPKYMLCFFDNNVASAHCVNNSNRSTQGVRHRRPVGKTPCYKKLDCFTRQRRAFSPVRNDRYKKQSRNNGKNIVITREWNDRSNPICAYCFASRCAPHGNDDDKNFQFDKFQRLLSVIYKKNSLTKEISK